MKTVLWGSLRGVQLGSPADLQIQAYQRQAAAYRRTNRVFLKFAADTMKAFEGFAKAMKALEKIDRR